MLSRPRFRAGRGCRLRGDPGGQSPFRTCLYCSGCRRRADDKPARTRAATHVDNPTRGSRRLKTWTAADAGSHGLRKSLLTANKKKNRVAGRTDRPRPRGGGGGGGGGGGTRGPRSRRHLSGGGGTAERARGLSWAGPLAKSFPRVHQPAGQRRGLQRLPGTGKIRPSAVRDHGGRKATGRRARGAGCRAGDVERGAFRRPLREPGRARAASGAIDRKNRAWQAHRFGGNQHQPGARPGEAKSGAKTSSAPVRRRRIYTQRAKGSSSKGGREKSEQKPQRRGGPRCRE